MGTGFSAQDIIRCHLCDKESPTLYCELCHVHLCTVCAGKRLLDESKEHRVVSIKNRSSDPICPKCPTHTSKLCELHCEQCDVHICVLCVSSKTHNGHDVVEILDFFKGKKKVVKKDLQELKKSINPRYKKIASKIPVQKSELIKNSQKLTTIIDKRGEDIHRKIDTIINKMKSEIGEMEVNYLNALQKQEDEIAQNISEITQSIDELQKLLRSNDVCLVSDYKSRNSEFRKLPPLLNISLPTFSGTKIDTDILYEQIGSLSVPSMTTQEHVYIESLGFSSRELLDVPRIVKSVDTELTGHLCSVACLSDERIWTIGQSNAMKLHNLQGQLLESIKTKSGNAPEDIAVTKEGNLVYTDPKDKSLNIGNSEIQTVIKLKKWIPLKVCSTSSGELLVLMLSNDDNQTKVVRYDGPKKKQSIQFNERKQPLFSSNPPFAYTKYITENRNKDICVTDNGASAVVVVNRAGKLRFTYTGVSNKLFDPVGITSDSQGRILISDRCNCIVHRSRRTVSPLH